MHFFILLETHKRSHGTEFCIHFRLAYQQYPDGISRVTQEQLTQEFGSKITFRW